MSLNLVPEGLEAVANAIESLTAQLLAAQARTGSAVAAVVPPAADPVSFQAAFGLVAHSARQQAAEVDGSQELGRSGVEAGQAAVSYQVGDALGAAMYVSEDL